MTAPLQLDVDWPGLVLGLVTAHDVSARWAGPELEAELATLLELRRGADFPPPPLRSAVRDLLRGQGYRPTGRGKPASEYLARAVDRDAFPRINGLVDAANLTSLESGLPISLLDLDRAREDGAALVLRCGRPGETFVFNTAGHHIDVGGLLLVARRDGEALGNPVKDSMRTKIGAETRNVLAVVYGASAAFPGDAAQGVRDVCERLAARLQRDGDGAATAVHLLPDPVA